MNQCERSVFLQERTDGNSKCLAIQKRTKKRNMSQNDEELYGDFARSRNPSCEPIVMRKVLILMFVAVLGSGDGYGRDLYVNNLTGDDQSTGETDQNISNHVGPVRSIKRAVALANFGDRIVLANTGVPYREQVSLQGARNSGSARFPFVLEGNGAELDGTADISPELWKPGGVGLIRFQPPRISFQQLFLAGQPLPEFSIADANMKEMPAGSWCMFKQSIYYRPQPDIALFDHDLSVSVRRVGVTLYNVRHVVVSNLVIRGFQYDGVNAHDNAFDCRLDGLTCRWNGRSGLSVGGASRVKVVNCMLENNGVVQLRTEGWSRVVVEGTKMIGDRSWEMDGGRLRIDGEDQQRKEKVANRDSAPLNRP